MKTREDIEKEIVGLNSQLTSIDLQIQRNDATGKSNHSLYIDKVAYGLQVHTLEWVLDREPVL